MLSHSCVVIYYIKTTATTIGEDLEKDHCPLSLSGFDAFQVPEQGAVGH